LQREDTSWHARGSIGNRADHTRRCVTLQFVCLCSVWHGGDTPQKLRSRDHVSVNGSGTNASNFL
jgi:hypothetical protein